MKKYLIGLITGGVGVYSYMMYKDGTLKRMIKNMPSKFKIMLNQINN